MAPKKNKVVSLASDQSGIFNDMVVFLVEIGVQARRLQIWKQKLVQMGAKVEDHITSMVTHIFANSWEALDETVGREQLMRFKGNLLSYKWLEDSLSSGEKMSEELYSLKTEMEAEKESPKSLEAVKSRASKCTSSDNETPNEKKIKLFPKDSESEVTSATNRDDKTCNIEEQAPNFDRRFSESFNPDSRSSSNKDLSLPYSPPDLNRTITEIFGKLINIYRALGDDRRSFSYYKAIPVIEKLSFKIESADQVKDLPTIGKAMQDHINEIVTTGKLSKLQHFETDEKVRTISLFGEVWGIGPATAMKLYDKGHRALDDLNNDESLTNSQRLGLKYFDDIMKRILRNEVQDMELLLKKAGEEVLPGVSIVCGGSFRRGKATCGDMDIIITHNDGKR
ncbi:hypothetical protein GIB67_000568 [Kingdonia uniflora]|uniref:DNA polymerase n=1 Tax=Kingdonia uniflora TaxID=39325 RepID=A0A7J7MIS8_9MAGN|nr:hypothetical protein GIB67_000568 [Kingdonia uniflora]